MAFLLVEMVRQLVKGMTVAFFSISIKEVCFKGLTVDEAKGGGTSTRTFAEVVDALAGSGCKRQHLLPKITECHLVLFIRFL